MTPSMPSPTMSSATITSMSVKPRLRARIGHTLLALVVFGRWLGLLDHDPVARVLALFDAQVAVGQRSHAPHCRRSICLLYTSDAADERSSVDLGGRRIIKKK